MEIHHDEGTTNTQTQGNIENFIHNDPVGNRILELKDGATMKTGVQATRPLS